jgi:hypothetical protein
MTHKQFKEIKQALLHDIEPIIAIAKRDIENVKVYDGPTASSRPTIPALSSTRISLDMLDKLVENVDHEVEVLKNKVCRLRRWLLYIDLINQVEFRKGDEKAGEGNGKDFLHIPTLMHAICKKK